MAGQWTDNAHGLACGGVLMWVPEAGADPSDTPYTRALSESPRICVMWPFMAQQQAGDCKEKAGFT